MNPPDYRIFVCTKQRSIDDPEGCCCNVGAQDIYQAFQDEIDRRQLNERVEVRRSGCLDRCESGAVALVCRPNRNEFAWLPTKLRVKLKRLLFRSRCYYGRLQRDNVAAIVESHLVNGKPLSTHLLSDEV